MRRCLSSSRLDHSGTADRTEAVWNRQESCKDDNHSFSAGSNANFLPKSYGKRFVLKMAPISHVKTEGSYLCASFAWSGGRSLSWSSLRLMIISAGSAPRQNSMSIARRIWSAQRLKRNDGKKRSEQTEIAQVHVAMYVSNVCHDSTVTVCRNEFGNTQIQAA